MSPFEALYGYEATPFGDLIIQETRLPRAKDFIQQIIDILNTLKDNLHYLQNQQKMYVDQKCVERTFKVGDLVFLKLQPYKQSSLKKKGAENLKPHFSGPYRILRRREVAYEIELPKNSKIHNIFPVFPL